LAQLGCLHFRLRSGEEIWVHPNVSFQKRGSYWIEYPPFQQGRSGTFQEERRNSDFIYVFDNSRSMYIRFPRQGDMSQFATKDNMKWEDLYFVEPQ
jgi:hypothetical protein